MINKNFTAQIKKASTIVGKTWPLYSFVTSNPLAGYEEMSFEDALNHAEKLMGISALPNASYFRQAWESGNIDQDILVELLTKAQFLQQPESYLVEMENRNFESVKNPHNQLDAIVSKWLGVFLDEGLAEWEMPNRTDGFYSAWRKVAIYDLELDKPTLDQIPETANEALQYFLQKFSNDEQIRIFEAHIASLPGWTGYIKYRTEEHSAWQQKFPIDLNEYLAVRLWIANHLYGKIVVPQDKATLDLNFIKVQHIWLKAWEKTFQVHLTAQLKSKNLNGKLSELDSQPLAQFVFCIDTRSEMIRRHIEQKNNYETFGYAGFFGLGTDYKDAATGLVRKSCPPIVPSAYTISEQAQPNQTEALVNHLKKSDFKNFGKFLSKRMKNMLPSAFGYVEGTGLFYGFAMFWRTLFPLTSTSITAGYEDNHESICQPEMHQNCDGGTELSEIPLAEKVAIVKSAFDLLGWKRFAPIIIFAGHASHSANNPFASSLDCGACAASPGRHNARMLAKLANSTEVRLSLQVDFNIVIPINTIFIGAEHDTTTDKIVLFDTEVPQSHLANLESLKLDLNDVQESTINERLGLKNNGQKESAKKASDWAETRPEWGLAGNAGFIIAPRNLTKHINLGNRCFLHSYNWEMDDLGTALETIMQGPMVVTQWINNHYYFSTVDNDKFGGGSKITHNVTGRFGVVNGNGGDLKIGLPLQSVSLTDHKMFHQPLRLSVVIQAPLSRVSEVLERNSNLKNLLNNNWIYLMVMDPQAKDEIMVYEKNDDWSPIVENKTLESVN